MEVVSPILPNSSLSVNPETESGSGTRENIGRWNATEHQLFLEGLSKYGKDWKAIAADIPTRSVVQVRTHAQKFFQKASVSNTRVPAPPQRTRRRDSVSSYHQEEQEKTESEPSSSSSPESSNVSTPNGSDATAVEQTTPKPSAIKVISSHQGTNAKPSSEFDLLVDYDLVLHGSSHDRPYRSLSPFELECNDNQDDLDSMTLNSTVAPFDSF